jgi:hypothetical protein
VICDADQGSPGLSDEAPSARIRALIAAGQTSRAALTAAGLIAETFGLPVVSAELTLDEYSLNSVSGRVRFADGHTEFFKFHQEEGEDANVAEYYRAQVLKDAGLPVEMPLRVAGEPGRQIALYELRTEPRLADVCVELERAGAALPPELRTARRALDRAIGCVAVGSLRPGSAASQNSAIHQLFSRRLTDPAEDSAAGREGATAERSAAGGPAAGRFPGGRYRSWYLADPLYRQVADHRFVVNGVEYSASLAELASAAARLLDPAVLAAGPAVTAHGDDHQGNIWVMNHGGRTELRLFDPAFADRDVPALLAPVKATFHNVFAHPFWLYHTAEAAQRLTVRVERADGVVSVDDDAALSPLRLEILESVAELIWAPLLAELARRSELPRDWRATVRAALFCCPLLVTNLVSASRSAPIRYLGLARAVMAGSEPLAGSDKISRFLDSVTPA